MGTPGFAVPSFHALIGSGQELVGAVTREDAKKGRGMQTAAPPVKIAALEAGLPVFQPATLKDGALLPLLHELAPELIVVVAYGKILPRYLLDFPKYGCVNLHASLLPRYRGASPIQWAIARGEQVTGVSVMQMDDGIDTGDVFARREVPIAPDDTGSTLSKKLELVGATLLAETVMLIEKGEIIPEKQDDENASHAPLLTKEMGRIDWDKQAAELDCLVRGMIPWPGAHTVISQTSAAVQIVLASVERENGRPGELLAVDRSGLVVACGTGALRITRIKPQGKGEMPVGDYLNGHALRAGEPI